MLCTKAFSVTLLFVFYVRCSVADRPNYLTDEDFAKARLLPAAANGTIFTLPQYGKDRPVSSIRGYTKVLLAEDTLVYSSESKYVPLLKFLFRLMGK